MKIYPSHDKTDEFIIHLSSQEMKNIQKGLISDHIMFTSPWSQGTIKQISQALEENSEYRLKSW